MEKRCAQTFVYRGHERSPLVQCTSALSGEPVDHTEKLSIWVILHFFSTMYLLCYKMYLVGISNNMLKTELIFLSKSAPFSLPYLRNKNDNLIPIIQVLKAQNLQTIFDLFSLTFQLQSIRQYYVFIFIIYLRYSWPTINCTFKVYDWISFDMNIPMRLSPKSKEYFILLCNPSPLLFWAVSKHLLSL